MELYDEIELEDLDYNGQTFTYPCPCGSLFVTTLKELQEGNNIAECLDCPLRIRIIYTTEDLSLFKGNSIHGANPFKET